MDIFAEIEISSEKSQPISPKAQIIGGGTTDPVRQKFYDMRGLASDNPYTWNDAQLFYKQAKFMENFTDDYNGHAEFSMHYPCFQRMGYERLRTYFTWRTAVRRGEFLPTRLSYVFLYVYELLACIGVDSPVQALAGLVALRKNYAEQFPALDDFLPAWFKDFHVYYELPHSFAEFADEHDLRNYFNEIFIFDVDSGLEAWNKISSYDIEKSKFYTVETENAKLLQDCFNAAIRALSALCAEKSIRLKDLFVLTNNHEMPWLPFRRALFHPWLFQLNRHVELPGGDTFLCKNNEWTTLYAAPYSHHKDLAAFIIKKTEACVRDATDFKTKITADTAALYKASTALGALGITSLEISNTIEKSITEFFKEKNRVIVNVDRKNLERIREEAEDITDKLIVEDEKEKDKTLGVSPPTPPQGDTVPLTPIIETAYAVSEDDIYVQFMQSLTDTEVEALKMIICEDGNINKLKVFTDNRGIMLEILVDNINEKAMDTINDNILELTDTLVIYEEYITPIITHLKITIKRWK